jgi:cytochrome c553
MLSLFPTIRRPTALVLCAAATLVVACQKAPENELSRGEVLWANCVSCHMKDGSGHEGIGAPAISGLPQWYVEAQLWKFRSAQRGSHFEDVTGMKMRPMARALPEEQDVVAVAAYVSQLPPVRNKVPVQGDPKKGQALFATCTACHGANAAGQEALRAPPLAGQDGWYLVAQLQKFKAGIRGTNPADMSGATMRPMSMLLTDEQAMRDVVAHIQSLAN